MNESESIYINFMEKSNYFLIFNTFLWGGRGSGEQAVDKVHQELKCENAGVGL